MSWNAKRYTDQNWTEKKRDGENWHHIPPRHPDQQPKFKIRKRVIDHRAYHQLFAAAPTFEDAVRILYHDWWKPYEQERMKCRRTTASLKGLAAHVRLAMSDPDTRRIA